MSYFKVPSGKRNGNRKGEYVLVFIDSNVTRILDYHACYGWRLVRKAGEIVDVAVTVLVSPRPGTKRGCVTHQIKLRDFIVGDIAKCQAVRYRDGNPLNNYRSNLEVYQAYYTEEINAPSKRKRSNICVGCKNEYTCRRVAAGKRLLSHVAGDRRNV